MAKQLADRHAKAAALMGDDARLPVPNAVFGSLMLLMFSGVGVGAVVGMAVSVAVGLIVAACVFGAAELMTLCCSMVNQNTRYKLAVDRIAHAPTAEIMCALASEHFTGRARAFAFDVLARRDAASHEMGMTHVTHA